MITIIGQPLTDSLQAAYRPIISRVQFSGNATAKNFLADVDSGVHAGQLAIPNAYITDPALFSVGKVLTLSNYPEWNGNWTIQSVSSDSTHNYFTMAQGAMLPGFTFSLRIASNGVLITDSGGGGTSGVPKVVYCDIYFDSVFYKTISLTQPAFGSTFDFDIQDAVQEFLESYLPEINMQAAENIPMVRCYCKFRSSSFDSNGFLVPEPNVPVQATSSAPAQSGSGTQGRTFYILNATLQHTDNQNLEAHLNSYKNAGWIATAYPLTHRPQPCRIGVGDSDTFPIANKSINEDGATLTLHTNSGFYSALVNVIFGHVLYLPIGPRNLATLFPGVDFNEIEWYFLKLETDKTGDVYATTPTYKINNCQIEDRVRLHFLNYMGTYDGVNFLKAKIQHETSSGERQTGLPTQLRKQATGFDKFNINSNDNYEARTSCYTESDMAWLQELLDSPKVFMEWVGTQGQDDNYLPVVITSKKMEKQKNQNEFRYDFIIEFKLSNAFISLR